MTTAKSKVDTEIYAHWLLMDFAVHSLISTTLINTSGWLVFKGKTASLAII